MPDDSDDLERIDSDIRVNERMHQLTEEAGEPLDGTHSPDAESLWRYFASLEVGRVGCYFDELIRAGVELPPPEDLDDAAVTAKLGELFEALARMRVFFSGTDHLSDRQLYEKLLRETLAEPTTLVEMDENSACHFDLSSSGEYQDEWLRYYADEESRQRWAKDFPEDEMPPHEAPPFDRDRHLPGARHGGE